MKKFNFKLDTLLKQKKLLKDEARREYSEAQEKANQKLGYIKHLYGQIDETREKISLSQKKKISEIHMINQLDEFIEGQKKRIDQERLKARELLSAAEDKHDKLVEASREFKKIEILKAKNYERFLKEKNKKEVKELDDLSMMRSSRRAV